MSIFFFFLDKLLDAYLTIKIPHASNIDFEIYIYIYIYIYIMHETLLKGTISILPEKLFVLEDQ